VDLESLKSRLRVFKKEEIILSNHALIRAKFRKIDIEEIKSNIINPTKLVYAEQQKTENKGEEKYNCYFAYSKDFAHRYVLVLDGKVIIVTIIVINKRWQGVLERRTK
jgi:hypothetical protein